MIYDFVLEPGLNQCEIFNNISFSCEKETFFNAVLINPECDLIIQTGKKLPKANYLIFLGIIPFDDILYKFIHSLQITNKQISGNEKIDSNIFDDLKIAIKKFINGDIYPRYYYLPPLERIFRHSVIDFQLIESKKFNGDLHEYLIKNKVARIKSSWRESIPTRFSSYTSRIGVDNDYDKIIDLIFTDYKLEFSI